MEPLNLKDLQHLADHFVDFAETCMLIRTKSGALEQLTLNKAQLHIHKCLEAQLQKTGKVRALILKGRQQGCSTYVAARFYHKATHNLGKKVFILTHREDATNNLFSMVNRYHNNVPEPLRAITSRANANQLIFSDVESSYAIGTSGGGTVGRSDTVQLFHGSECGFWDNTEEISSGIMQTIPDMAGTEIIMESTANGMGNMFHKMCMNALRGESEYQLIFVPWFWQDEYRKQLPQDFQVSSEEAEYMERWGLDKEQIYWRRIKTQELVGGEWQFKQEYPADVHEAFQSSDGDSFITANSVYDARRRIVERTFAPLVVGVDPARFGNDRTAIVWRQGRHQGKHVFYSKKDTMEVVGIIVQIIRTDKPVAVFIDIGGLGAGIYDRLVELGYNDIVRSVNFGGSALNDAIYKNKRAEIWGEMREWLKEGKIEDNDELQASLTTPLYKFDSAGRVQLESKDDIKKRGLPSPDLGDGFALTFAAPVVTQDVRMEQFQRQTKALAPTRIY